MKKRLIPLLLLVAVAALLAAGCQDLKSPLVDRAWVLASYRGPDAVIHDALPGVDVTATFDGQTGKVGGSGGCNSYSADFHVDKLTLTIDMLQATERACLEPERNAQETAFFSALGQAQEFRVGHNVLTITGGGWDLEFNEKTTATP
jgi:heat shock protein HslJ